MRSHWDHPRPIAAVRILAALGEEQGFGAETALRGSGIALEALQTPEAMVEASQELQVARNLLAALEPDYPLGLEAGMRSHATAYGVWGFALLASPTVREAIRVGLRYLDLTSVFCRIEPRDTREALELVGHDAELPPDLRQFIVERDAATVYTLIRDMLGEPPDLAGVQFKFDPPSYTDALAYKFGCLPQFNQSRNCFAIRHATLDQPLPQADSLTLQNCEFECQKLLSRYRSREGFSGLVRAHLLKQPGQLPGMQHVAQELAMTPRTLRRRLAAENTSFDALRVEVHATLAGELLSSTDLSIEQIADRLGYAEPSCFSRAFKKWRDVTPRGFRQQNSVHKRIERRA